MNGLKGKLGVSILTTEPTKRDFPAILNNDVMNEVKNFHLSVEGYEATPLVPLDNLAELLGVKKIFVKDESYRFGLNAFKGLGATYAIAKILCKKLSINIRDVNYDYFKTDDVAKKINNMVFTTASDGNHGRALAWAAAQLGCKAIIYLNKGTAKRRVDAIWHVGGEAYVTEVNYDDTVRLATRKAEENGWYLVQDTAFEGYQDIPKWILQGYATMGVEAIDQLNLQGINKPTHVFLQAGVGAMAGGVLGCYVNRFAGDYPYTIIVEPTEAACYYESALAGDGQAHFITGDLETIMVGLACGEPNPITWEIIRDFANAYVTCEDYIPADGMRMLGNPIKGDKKIISGESGAVGIGLLSVLMNHDIFENERNKFGLNKDSIVLIFSTEGDTDPEHYKEIVHDGKYPSPFNKD